MRSASSLLALAVVVGGCATGSSSAGGGVAPPPSVVTSRGAEATGAHMYVAPDTREGVAEYAGDVEAVWNATVDAYRSLGIETVISESEALVGNPRFDVRRRLGGERLSKYVRCGPDDTGMPAADSYRVRLDVRSRVEPLPDARARVTTTVEATARDMSGTSNSPVQCASTGGLEQRIAAEVARRLGGGG